MILNVKLNIPYQKAKTPNCAEIMPKYDMGKPNAFWFSILLFFKLFQILYDLKKVALRDMHRIINAALAMAALWLKTDT